MHILQVSTYVGVYYIRFVCLSLSTTYVRYSLSCSSLHSVSTTRYYTMLMYSRYGALAFPHNPHLFGTPTSTRDLSFPVGKHSSCWTDRACVCVCVHSVYVGIYVWMDGWIYVRRCVCVCVHVCARAHTRTHIPVCSRHLESYITQRYLSLLLLALLASGAAMAGWLPRSPCTCHNDSPGRACIGTSADRARHAARNKQPSSRTY
jgi:hypothetical protein